MVTYTTDPDHSHGSMRSTGVLLTNLGTPDAPTSAAVRRYLAEFLWDPRVIEAPRWLWWLILHGVILRVRPSRSARAYRKVWSEAGSPLMDISQRQARALGPLLAPHFHGPVEVALAMRYGNPSIAEGLDALRRAGARRVIVVPLYPQYSATTTASTFDAVSDVLRRWRWLPELRFMTGYHDDPAYVGALAASLREAWADQPPAERLLFSFHGLPRRYLLAGDPYHCECHKTARLLCEALGLERDRWALSFQSRVGREEWLRPYTDELLAQWAKEGVRTVDVVCPGFSADCLETLEEIAMQNAELFREAGGERLRYVPALNDRPDHLRAIADLILARTPDWQAIVEDEQRAAERKAVAVAGGAPG